MSITSYVQYTSMMASCGLNVVQCLQFVVSRVLCIACFLNVPSCDFSMDGPQDAYRSDMPAAPDALHVTLRHIVRLCKGAVLAGPSLHFLLKTMCKLGIHQKQRLASKTCLRRWVSWIHPVLVKLWCIVLDKWWSGQYTSGFCFYKQFTVMTNWNKKSWLLLM